MTKSVASNISPATVKDAIELSALVNSAYRGESSKKGWTTEADLLGGQRTDPEKIQEMIETDGTVILKLLLNDSIAGCVHLEKREDDCYLGMLTVKPTLQDQGLGKTLLFAGEDFAKTKWKCKSVSMTVITTRTELLNWYKKHGYSNTGEVKPFPMNDPRFGIPKVGKIEFHVLRKIL